MMAFQLLGDLTQGDVLTRPHQAKNEGRVPIQLRARRMALTQRHSLTSRPPLSVPASGRRYPDRKTSRCRPRRKPVLDRRDHPSAKVQTISTCHICLPISLGIQNHVCQRLGILYIDSEFMKAALALSTGHGMIDMYAFYEREMPRFGWNQITIIRSSVSTMTYSRGPRVATITLHPKTTGGSNVDFTVAPGAQGSATYRTQGSGRPIQAMPSRGPARPRAQVGTSG